ncbi:hypothetical protein PYCC9005_002353 [Savitreella phatthalungensis]
MHPSLEPFANTWVRDYVLAAERDMTLTLGKFETRTPKSDTEDSFIAVTLNTESTIKRAASLHRMPKNDGSGDMGELVWFLEIGNGMNGHANILHGGMTAVIFDEIMGACQFYMLNNSPSFTGNLTVDYRAPVPAPSILMVRAQVTKIERRKRYVVAQMLGPDGLIYAEGKSLFIGIKPKV